MIEILPAVMPKDYQDLLEKAALVSPFVSAIQIDVMDGKFVPEKTWPYFSYGDKDFAALLAEDAGLPFWEKLDYEIDLMTSAPEADAFDWIRAGAKRLVLHVESTKELTRLIQELRAEFGSFKENPLFPEIGIASNNDTPLSIVEGFLPEADFLQCMGIARIGYQGEPFDERVLERIAALRKKDPMIPISVDGAVTPLTAHSLVQAGATRLISGSFIFEDSDPQDEIAELKKAVT